MDQKQPSKSKNKRQGKQKHNSWKRRPALIKPRKKNRPNSVNKTERNSITDNNALLVSISNANANANANLRQPTTIVRKAVPQAFQPARVRGEAFFR